MTFLTTPAGWAKVLTGRAGALGADPADLDAAVKAGAFEGLKKAVRDGATLTTATVGEANLGGRTGAGHSAADKWRAVANSPVSQRYVIANGYGADPSVHTDAALLAADPYAVIEGLAIAAFATGATDAILVVRGEDAAAVSRLEGAVGAAEEAGLLGDDACGSGYRITVTVRGLQGSYMLGEQTSLIRALEGKRAQPDQVPPYPTERGLFDKPTLVHGVQTLAAVPWIVREGADAYRKAGADGAAGTMLVQLRGPQGGVAEVPMGTPLRELVTLAGGKPDAVKAVLVGGSTGGFVPASALDTPFEAGALKAAGATIGSGSVTLVDQRACVVDLARLLTRFAADSACGKSIPCRIGLRRLSEIGDRIAAGNPRAGDANLMTDLAHDIAASGLCDHERLATLAFTSAMTHFRDEVDAHLLRSQCPAGVCMPIAMGAGSQGSR